MKVLLLNAGPVAALFFTMLLLQACSNNDIYNQYQPVAPEGWHADSALNFVVEVPNQHTAFNVFLNIRHMGDYPYSNLWLFVNRTAPDSTVQMDTVQVVLADLTGRWHGEGSGVIYHYSLPYRSNRPMLPRGTYHYEIRQGMRDTLLRGVKDVGLRLEYLAEEQ